MGARRGGHFHFPAQYPKPQTPNPRGTLNSIETSDVLLSAGSGGWGGSHYTTKCQRFWVFFARVKKRASVRAFPFRMSSVWTETYDLCVVNLRAQSCLRCSVVPFERTTGGSELSQCARLRVYCLFVCVLLGCIVGCGTGLQWSPLRWVFVSVTV